MEILQEAQNAFRSRNFPEAERLLTLAWEQSPEEPVILLRLGQVNMALGKFEESFDFLRKSQKIDPNNPDVYRAIGMSIRMSGMIDLGISYLGIMLTYSPLTLQSQIHLTLAELFAAKGDLVSLQNSLLLLEKLPSDNARMELRLWQEVNDTDGMIRLASRFPEIQELAFGIAYERSNPQQAIEYLQSQSCSSFWEADLAMYRLHQEPQYLQQAYEKASKTAEVLVEVAKMQKEGGLPLLERLSQSPIVFASVRKKALDYLSL